MTKTITVTILCALGLCAQENGPAALIGISPPLPPGMDAVRDMWHGAAGSVTARISATQVGGFNPGPRLAIMTEDLGCSLPIYNVNSISGVLGIWGDPQYVFGLKAVVFDNFGWKGTDLAYIDQPNNTTSSGTLPCVEDVQQNIVRARPGPGEPETTFAAAMPFSANGGRVHMASPPASVACNPTNPASACYAPPVTVSATGACNCTGWTDTGHSCVVTANGQSGTLQTRSCDPGTCGASSYCKALPQQSCISSPWTPTVCGGTATNGSVHCQANQMLMAQTDSCFFGSPNGPAWNCQTDPACEARPVMEFTPANGGAVSHVGGTLALTLSVKGINGYTGTLYLVESSYLSGVMIIHGIPFSVDVQANAKDYLVTVQPYNVPTGQYTLTVAEENGLVSASVPFTVY